MENMPYVFATREGYLAYKATGSAKNTATTPADVDVTINVSELTKVLDVISVYGSPASGFTVKSITGNNVTVTASSVPAGATVNVTIIAIGV